MSSRSLDLPLLSKDDFLLCREEDPDKSLRERNKHSGITFRGCTVWPIFQTPLDPALMEQRQVIQQPRHEYSMLTFSSCAS